MASIPQQRVPQPKVSFLSLPIEIRNMVFDLFIPRILYLDEYCLSINRLSRRSRHRWKFRYNVNPTSKSKLFGFRSLYRVCHQIYVELRTLPPREEATMVVRLQMRHVKSGYQPPLLQDLLPSVEEMPRRKIRTVVYRPYEPNSVLISIYEKLDPSRKDSILLRYIDSALYFKHLLISEHLRMEQMIVLIPTLCGQGHSPMTQALIDDDIDILTTPVMPVLPSCSTLPYGASETGYMDADFDDVNEGHPGFLQHRDAIWARCHLLLARWTRFLSHSPSR